MDFENILELFHFDILLESLGILFGFGLLWQLFLQQGISSLFIIFITTIC